MNTYNHIQMGKLKFTLSNIFFWLGLVASCLLMENVSFLSENTVGMSDLHFYLLFVFSGICYITYFLLDHVYNRSSVDFVLLGVLLLGLGAGTVGIWSLKSFTLTGVGTYTFTINPWIQIRQTCSLAMFIMTVYATLFFFNKNYPSMKKVSILFIVLTMFCYISIIYSLAVEMGKYIEKFTPEVTHTIKITSFFWNDNMYCGMLIMGMASSIGLNYFKKNALSYISIFAFLIMIIIVGSMTSIIVGMFATMIYFLLEIALIFKKNVKKAIIWLTVYLGISMAIFVLFASAINRDMGQFSTICQRFYDSFRTAEYSTLHLRTFTWGEVANYLGANPIQLLFGVGFNNSNNIVAGFWQAYRGSMVESFSTHSGYYQILMNFGVVGLAIYASIVVYYFYCVVKLFKRDPRFALLYLLIGMIMFAYAVMESVILFNPNAQGMLVGIVFFLPLINRYKHLKHPELGDNVIEVEKPELISEERLGQSIARAIMGLIVVACSFFIFPAVRENERLFYLVLNIVIVLALCLLTYPFALSGLARTKSRPKLIALLLVSVVPVLGLTGFLMGRYYLDPNGMSSEGKWAIAIILIIFLAFECILSFIYSKRGALEYAKCFIGVSKLAFMGIVGSVGAMLLVYFNMQYFDYSPLTLIVYGASILLVYYAFSFIIPFTESKDIYGYFNSLGMYSLKMDVLKDRLEAIKND